MDESVLDPAWWPPSYELLDDDWTRIELVDDEDPTGFERGSDHVVAASIVWFVLLDAAVARFAHAILDVTIPLSFVAITLVWFRAATSGIFVSTRGLKVVNLPRRLIIPWDQLDTSVRDGRFGAGQQLVVSGPAGKTSLTLNALAAGLVLAKDQRWRNRAVQQLRTHLADLARESI
jgi:hypothetical protein